MQIIQTDVPLTKARLTTLVKFQDDKNIQSLQGEPSEIRKVMQTLWGLKFRWFLQRAQNVKIVKLCNLHQL